MSVERTMVGSFPCNRSHNRNRNRSRTFDDVSDDVFHSILCFLPAADLLLRNLYVSTRWAETVRSEMFWRNLYPVVHYETKKFLNVHQIQRCCLYQELGDITDGTDVPAFLCFGSLFPSLARAEVLRNSGLRVCAATSTDHANEAIENVLPRRSRRLNYWSSAPSRTSDSNELLLFTTRCPLAVLSTITIKSLREPTFFLGPQVYTWKKVQFHAYRLPLSQFSIGDTGRLGFPCSFEDGNGAMKDDEEDFLTGPRSRAPPSAAVIQKLLQGYSPVYESEKYSMPPDLDREVTYSLPPGVVANVVTMSLLGKNFEQMEDMGYYVCVERADCCGIPLYSNLDDEVAFS